MLGTSDTRQDEHFGKVVVITGASSDLGEATALSSEVEMNLFTAMPTTISCSPRRRWRPDDGHTRGGSSRPAGTVGEFHGDARVEMLFEALDSSHASGGSVTFEAVPHTLAPHPRPDPIVTAAASGDAIQTFDWETSRIPAGRSSGIHLDTLVLVGEHDGTFIPSIGRSGRRV